MPAPLIATALAAIAPALARRGLDLLSGVFRGALDQGAAAVSQLIEEKTGIDINDVADGKLTDEQWAKLREFEFAYQAKLLEYRQQSDANALEVERLHQADRANARDLQKAALASDDVVARRFIYFYATGITLLTFVFIFYAAFGHDYSNSDNADATRIIDTVLGFLLGVSLSAIIQYFFGSSAGSKAKAEQIDAMSKDLAANSTRDKPSQGGGL
ncbi:MAG: hypothetical protein II007_12690 [Gammaproteobacteria bacterium]|nr:hypothetical protein [Gammaproteobacteria bacterium]